MNKAKLYLITGLFVLAMFSLLLFINYAGTKKTNELLEIIAPVSSCNPQQQVCKIVTDKFSAEITFDKNIIYLKPFNVIIKTKEKENQYIESIHVDFKMKGMEMGVNRFNLLQKDFSQNTVRWEGKALLPVCVTGRVDWFSEVEIVTSKEKYVYSFPMLVRKTNP